MSTINPSDAARPADLSVQEQERSELISTSEVHVVGSARTAQSTESTGPNDATPADGATRRARSPVLMPDDRSGSNAVAEQQATLRQQQLAADMAENPGLVEALAVVNLHPTPEGVDRVNQAANQSPNDFNFVVANARLVAESGGADTAALGRLERGMTDFVSGNGLRATDTEDLAYILARVMVEHDAQERDDALQMLQEAKRVAVAELNRLQEDLRELDNPDQTVNQGDQGDGKKDDGGSSQSTESVAAVEAAKQEQKALASKIANQQDLVNDLSSQIAALKAGDGLGAGTNGEPNDILNDAIMAMALKAETAAQNSAWAARGPSSSNSVNDARPAEGAGTPAANGGTGSGGPRRPS